MINPFSQSHTAKVLALAALVLTGCVDNDYDLTKDIDMTVQVGGDFTFPSSTTENYTLAQIMDLKPTSSIKPYGEAYGMKPGDYVLIQQGNDINSSFNIPVQNISAINCESSTISVPVPNIGNTAVDFTINSLVNDFSLAENNIDKSVRSLSYAQTDILFNLTVSMATASGKTGTMTINPGFTIDFPAGWLVEPGSTDAAKYCKSNGTKIVFTAPKSIGNNGKLTIPVRVTGVKLSGLASGQGLYAPGKLRLDAHITSSGTASFKSSAIPAGQTENISLTVSPAIASAKILAVTGCVDPDIEISATTINIQGIPEYLSYPNNNLDLTNPQIQLVIKNTSPIDYNISGRLTAIDQKGLSHTIYVGQQYGTSALIAKANATSNICLSRTGSGHMAGNVQQIALPNLSELIESVPQRIVIDEVSVKTSDNEFTVTLGEDYRLDIKHTIVAPLAFGKDLRFTYITHDKGWNEDLSKYSFKEALVTVDVENTVPVDMVAEVNALDKNGNVIKDVTAEVSGTVKAGCIGQKIKSQLSVTLRSESKNIGNLDGIQFVFTATSSDRYVGTALNQEQEMRFTNIKVKLLGGIGIDLN